MFVGSGVTLQGSAASPIRAEKGVENCVTGSGVIAEGACPARTA